MKRTTWSPLSSSLRTKLVLVLLAGLLPILSGCEETSLTPNRITSRTQVGNNRFGACFPELDRAGIGAEADNFPLDREGVPAGYLTEWKAGAPPFPCNRLTQRNVQGLFDFNVNRLRDGSEPPQRFRSAILELVEFRPVSGGIRVTTTPSGGFGEGVLSGTVNTCRFKVLANHQAWGTARSGPIIRTVELASHPRQIVVFNTGASRWQADVSQEVGAWYREERPETGFSVVADDPEGFNAHASNTCAGYFQFRLRTFLGED